MSKKAVIEAALFMASDSLDMDELMKISGANSISIVEEAIDKIREEKLSDESGIELIEDPDGWRFGVKMDYSKSVVHLASHSDLGSGLTKTLALIAFKEPAMQSEIIKIQGNKAYSYVAELEKRSLISSSEFGKTKLLRTTKDFEKYFGTQIEKVKEHLQKEWSSFEKECLGKKGDAGGNKDEKIEAPENIEEKIDETENPEEEKTDKIEGTDREKVKETATEEKKAVDKKAKKGKKK